MIIRMAISSLVRLHSIRWTRQQEGTSGIDVGDDLTDHVLVQDSVVGDALLL